MKKHLSKKLHKEGFNIKLSNFNLKQSFNIKSIIFIIFIIIGAVNNGFTQSVPDIKRDVETKKFIYTEVVSVEGTKDELYDRCISWFNSFYKNVANVAKKLVKIEGLVEGAHRFKIYDIDSKGLKTDAGLVGYDITFNFKDGRYKYTITNISWKQTSSFPIEKWADKNAPSYNVKYDNYLIQVDTKMKEVVESLKKGMLPKDVKKDDNW
ncbi:MAG: hypothetical protein A2X12_03880 [Bacteroidetes bacterium GWE2_29_8]|nr:MAG: hypothetical protein A2X12_03880 [Bacteroidetes bacterium GWE2_29_8]OFY21884.1 MAG: hypothetical protein A2X02_05125 [Bacteroidetes bacterium GWF2_29_10]